MKDVKLLLIDDNPEERAYVRRQLSGTDLNLAQVEECGAGAECHALLREFSPDAIIVGFNEPIARPLKTIESLAMEGTGVVIVISSRGDRDYLRKAMRAGAREYLVKPIRPKDLAQAVQEVLGEEKRRKNAQLQADSGRIRSDVFTVIGSKGGIGKTTLATNLAVALAVETKQQVVVVDLAPQLGDVAMMLDVVPERTIADLTSFTRALEPEVLESFLSSHPSGVKVLAAAPDASPNSLPSAKLVRQIVEGLTKNYDYVVIDGDQLLTPVLWAALELTTMLLMVTCPDTSSIKNTRVFLEMLGSRGYPDDRVKMVINYPYSHNGISSGELSKVLDYPIFWKVPHDAACSQCGNLGQSFVQARPRAKVSQNILQLARTMSGVHTKRNGLLGFIKR